MTSPIQSYPVNLAFCLTILVGTGALVIERQGFVQANRNGQVVLQGSRTSLGWSVYNMGQGKITHHLIK